MLILDLVKRRRWAVFSLLLVAVIALLVEVGCVPAGGQVVPSTQALPPTSIPTATSQPTPMVSPTITHPRLSGGAAHTCLVTDSGGVACWGANDFGQLGVDAQFVYEDFGKPFEVIGIPGRVDAISAGAYHTCVLTTDGAVDCWGQNQYGQLGNNTTTDSNKPSDVSGLAGGISQISAGYAHTCAVTTEGGGKCWGQNESGLLGDGTTTNRNMPVDVQGLPGRIIQVVAGWVYTCALTESGQVWCWGNGANDRFGDGSDYTTPVRVAGEIEDVTLLTGGQYHLCALTGGGQVLCWGSLSSAEQFSPDKPMVIEGLSGAVVELVAGGGHTCALTITGGVQCWGDNYFGQLGDGTDLGSWTPVSSMGLTSGVETIGSGGGHVCALLDSGEVTCWGDGSFGQLSNGTVTSQGVVAVMTPTP